MNLKQFHEKYGNEATERLLDVLLIEQKLSKEEGKQLCIDLGILSKRSRANIWVNIFSGTQRVYTATGRTEEKTYTIRCINGRNEYALQVVAFQSHIDEVIKLIRVSQ